MFQAEGLFEPILVSDKIAKVTSANNWVQKMVEVEGALALAEAELGIIPEAAAKEIAALSKDHGIDPSELGRSARDSGTPVISLVQQLGGKLSTSSKAWIHFGATSQDILDSATMLVVKDVASVILGDLASTCRSLAALALRYRQTPMVSRTLLQHALPSTFGLKAAIWLGSVSEAGATLSDFYQHRLCLQFGGAGGTLAALGDQGVEVGQRCAQLLGLGFAIMPWHAQRNRIGELGSSLTLIVGSLAKIATDVALGSQAEIGEIVELQNGGGGSSAMPQKVNPVGSIVINAAFRRAQGLIPVLYGCMVAENERGASEWQAEWQTLRDLLQLTGGASERASQMVANLRIDDVRMAENLELGRGSVMSEKILLRLSESQGRTVAHELVKGAGQRSASNGTSLADELAKEDVFRQTYSPEEILTLFDPLTYLGSTQKFIDGALSQWETFEPKWRKIVDMEAGGKS